MTPPDASPAWRLEIHHTLPSTSDALLARTDEPAGLAILAHRQTKGRGSHGRAWVAPEGNLNLSFLLRPTRPRPWALLAAVASRQALADPAIRLKWPNDLLLDGKKLGGILIEAAADWVVIGIGVNLRHAPDLPDRKTVALGPTAAAPEMLARDILAAVSHWLNVDDADVCMAWLAAAPPLGSPLQVTQTARIVSGAFAGLTREGHLLLAAVDGLKEISAGRVTE